MKKSNKAIQKRVKISKTGKLLRRPLKQNHLKSKLSGQKNQDKRREMGFHKTDEKTLKAFLPFNK